MIFLVEQYLGHWKQQVTHDQEAYDVMCTEVHKLQTPTRVDVSISCEVQGLLSNPFTNSFSLKGSTITNDDVPGIQGMLNKNGSITWIKNGSIYTTWERPSKTYLINLSLQIRNIRCVKLYCCVFQCFNDQLFLCSRR